jgi:hypothetical protein
LSALFDEFEFGVGGRRDVVVGRRRRSVGETGRSGVWLFIVLAFEGRWSGVVLRFVRH